MTPSRVNAALASSLKTLLPVTDHQNIPAALFLQALRLHSPRAASQKTDPACYNANSGKKLRWRQANVAHVSRRAVSPFLATCLSLS